MDMDGCIENREHTFVYNGVRLAIVTSDAVSAPVMTMVATLMASALDV
jgi:hypothetical protein